MNRLTKHLCVISFDGLSTLDFDYIATLPNFKEFLRTASYSKKVYSIYPTLTYPAHATIVTGRYPKNHGIINNTLLQPHRESPDWYWERRYIKGETLFDQAINDGMKVAALLWPVTAKSRIQYNMPEMFANRPWQNQILVSLLNGSPWFQIVLNHKFGHLREGTKQPYLDNFTHQALLYTLEKKRPDLTLAHYTDLDTMRHYHGFDSKEAREALQRHDQRLGEIVNKLKSAGIYQESALVVLGDHSSLDEDKAIHLNVLLKEHGYINVNTQGQIVDYTAIAKSCDGSAYIYTKPLNNLTFNRKIPKEDTKIETTIEVKLQQVLEEFNQKQHCFDAIYTNKEAQKFGADPKCIFMLEASSGYYFVNEISEKAIVSIRPEHVGAVPHYTKAAHGYSPYKENYTTVFIAAGRGIKQGAVLDEMQLVDEGPTLAKLLGINLEQSEGRILNEFLVYER